MLKPRYSIAYSLRDPAGSGVAKILAEILDAVPAKCPRARKCFRLSSGVLLGGYDDDTINLEFIDQTPDPEADAVIILSRHSATSGRPSLTTHHTGNPTDRVYGGEPYTLSWSAPPLSKALLTSYKIEAGRLGLLNEYEVTLEATHHGPTKPRKPLVFIEIGSTPDRWIDKRAQEAMAKAVANVLNSPLPDCIIAVGFGEPHYPIKFTKMHLDSEYCMGHIIPKYALPLTKREVIEQAIRKTWPQEPVKAFIQKKSVRSKYRRELISILEEMGVEVELI